MALSIDVGDLAVWHRAKIPVDAVEGFRRRRVRHVPDLVLLGIKRIGDEEALVNVLVLGIAVPLDEDTNLARGEVAPDVRERSEVDAIGGKADNAIEITLEPTLAPPRNRNVGHIVRGDVRRVRIELQRVSRQIEIGFEILDEVVLLLHARIALEEIECVPQRRHALVDRSPELAIIHLARRHPAVQDGELMPLERFPRRRIVRIDKEDVHAGILQHGKVLERNQHPAAGLQRREEHSKVGRHFLLDDVSDVLATPHRRAVLSAERRGSGSDLKALVGIVDQAHQGLVPRIGNVVA